MVKINKISVLELILKDITINNKYIKGVKGIDLIDAYALYLDDKINSQEKVDLVKMKEKTIFYYRELLGYKNASLYLDSYSIIDLKNIHKDLFISYHYVKQIKYNYDKEKTKGQKDNDGL